MENKGLSLSELTVVASSVSFTGRLEIAREAHIYGKIVGELFGKPGSLLLIKQGAHVEGKVFADSVIVDGFLQGEIEAAKRVWITSSGRVVGSVKTPSLQVDPGAIFEAKVKM